MAYDEELAHRIREQLQDISGVTEMRMFGGLAFLVGGNMAVAARGQRGVVLTAPPDQTAQLAAAPHAGRFALPGREMNGWLRVDAAGVESDEDLARWVDIGVRYASSLPPK